ncbi:transporter substrate-binding domain-containing protein [Oxalobacteraceae bacterium]|nr:transporter substrate-binding domain-containing protein [Oxalobacteraceae bacterium]
MPHPLFAGLRLIGGALVCALVLCAPARAACTREIVVPVAPTGYSVIVNGDTVSGAFPDLLREMGQQLGCRFRFPVVPRARMAYMFLDSAEADLMLPASRSAERDARADFIPMMRLKVNLVSLKSQRLKLASVDQLLARPALRGVAVRSYVFGDEYNALLRRLEAQQRVFYANDLLMAARMLEAGRADFTIVAPTIFLSALADVPELAALRRQLVFTELEGLPPTDSGAYISRRALGAPDRAALRHLLEQAAHGPLWRAFLKYYPPEIAAYVVR